MNEVQTADMKSRADFPWSGALTGGFVGSLALATVKSGGGALSPSLLGLLLPFAVSLSLFGGLLFSVLSRLTGAARTELWSSSRVFRFRLLLSGPLILVSAYLLAHISVPLLDAFSSRKQVGGVLLAVLAVGLFSSCVGTATFGAQILAKKREKPGLLTVLLFGVVVPLAGAVLLVGFGTPSGQGSPFALFGVLRRAELDLSPVFEALVIGSFVLTASGLSVRRIPVVLTRLAALAGFLLSLWGLFQASELTVRDGAKMERRGGLAPLGLKLSRRLSDSDGDGYSGLFGGGDCGPGDPSVYPGALDVADNGLDEDCSGTDKVTRQTEVSTQIPPQARAAQLPEKPNFLLLSIDTLRFDLGYAAPARRPKLSPNLDALAARSTVFTQAYALASYTSKSLGPALIGRYPSEVPRTFEHFDRFDKEVPFVQERLQAAGVETVSVQGYWYFFFKGYGFERGFDVIDKSAAPKVVTIEGDKSKNGHLVADATIAELRRLSERGGAPPNDDAPSTHHGQFYLWAHWVDPHYEYVRHEDFDYGPEERDRYDSEISFVDHQVGRVLSALKELGLAEKTVVLVTSDHGEAFGEHGMIRHGFEVWDELVRVPLLLYVPGVKARQVTQRRSLIDLTPTILDTFAIKPRAEDDFVRGTSLHEDALLSSDEEPKARPVLVDMVQGPHNQERRAFYSGDHKLITSLGRPLGLYNLAEDPAEKTDLSGNEELTARILKEMNDFVDDLKPVAAQK